MTVLKDILEKIFRFFDREPYSNEIGKAKKDYFDRIGQVFEDDKIFEMRLASFFDWFIFERPMDGIGLPPIRVYYHAKEKLLREDERADLECFLNTVWSLFMVNGKSSKGWEIADLYDSKVYVLPYATDLDYIGSGSVVEGRLVDFRGSWMFTEPALPHPKEVTGFIEKESKKQRAGTREAFKNFLITLAEMSIRAYRYKHLKVNEVYKLK